MSLPVYFPLPDDIRERLVSMFEEDPVMLDAISVGSSRLGKLLMDRHQELDKPVSRERAIKLLDMDPRSEEGIKARKALNDPDRLYWLIRHWYEFILDGPPLPVDFVEQAKGWFPKASELHDSIERRSYSDIHMILSVAADILRGGGFIPWQPGERVLGFRRESAFAVRQAAAERATSLFEFFWEDIYKAYLEALSGLPLARELGYMPLPETTVA